MCVPVHESVICRLVASTMAMPDHRGVAVTSPEVPLALASEAMVHVCSSLGLVAVTSDLCCVQMRDPTTQGRTQRPLTPGEHGLWSDDAQRTCYS